MTNSVVPLLAVVVSPPPPDINAHHHSFTSILGRFDPRVQASSPELSSTPLTLLTQITGISTFPSLTLEAQVNRASQDLIRSLL